jgi:hypothetical protein
VTVLVYLLCAVTSLACAVLLFRGFRQSRARMLLWSALCFGGFFLNNLLLVIDTQLGPVIDLSIWRALPAALGLAALLYGFIWDADR